MSTYAWVIDKDHLAEVFDGVPMGPPEEGIIGPSTAPDDLLARIAAGEGEKFRMYDGDGELNYSGRIVGREHDESDGFAPLDEFGMGNAGCTSIQYLIGGKWETL